MSVSHLLFLLFYAKILAFTLAVTPVRNFLTRWKHLLVLGMKFFFQSKWMKVKMSTSHYTFARFSNWTKVIQQAEKLVTKLSLTFFSTSWNWNSRTCYTSFNLSTFLFFFPHLLLIKKLQALREVMWLTSTTVVCSARDEWADWLSFCCKKSAHTTYTKNLPQLRRAASCRTAANNPAASLPHRDAVGGWC